MIESRPSTRGPAKPGRRGLFWLPPPRGRATFSETKERLLLGRRALGAATFAELLPHDTVERVAATAEQQNSQAPRQIQSPKLALVPGATVVRSRQSERRYEGDEECSETSEKPRGHQDAADEFARNREYQGVLGPEVELIWDAPDSRAEVVELVPAV